MSKLEQETVGTSERSRDRWAKALSSLKSAQNDDLPPELLGALQGVLDRGALEPGAGEPLGLDMGGLGAILPPSAFFEALEQTSVAISITDPNARILYANCAYEALTGYRLEALIGRNQSINSDKKTPLTVYKSLWETILSGESWNGRLLNRREDGEAYVADLTITPIRADDGDILYFLCVHANVTDLHRLERRLTNQKQLTESVINLAPVIMALVDTDRAVVLDNLAYKTLMGDMQGREPADELLAALKDVIGEDLEEACRKNRSFADVEVSLEVGPDRTRWFSCSGEWVKEFDVAADAYFKRRTKDALLLCCTEITAQRREYQRAQFSAVRAMMAEQQMTQRVHEVATAAAFQLQGPLNVIKALSDMMRRQGRSDPSLEAALGQVLESGGLAIETLRHVTPKGVDEALTTIHLNDLVRDVLVVSMEGMAGLDISVDWHPSREPLYLIGRANSLRNLFKSVLDNAVDAIQKGASDWRKVRVTTRRSGDDRAEICIEDSGPGIPREVRSRAFEPFFSGWPNSAGKAGIGLSIARQAAADHGGSIEIDDRYKGGCRVRILLPLTNERRDKGEDARRRPV
ncbi:MAG: nitrogen fixation negative regulator NifL [Pseudomonadota bacterium]